MKGLTHFTVGVMVATFFAYAVEGAVIDKLWMIVLGGAFGILPDTLDFKFGRFFEKFDYELMPTEESINAREIAEAVARAIDEAYTLGKVVKVKLHTIKVGADMWRKYSIRFIPEEHAVEVKVGPIVSTGQWPYPGTEPKEISERTYYKAYFKAPLHHTYEKENDVTIFSGPDFEFVPENGQVDVQFIPWHRRWSHSFTVGLLFAPLGYLFYGFNTAGFYAALIIFFAFASHIVTDQLGYMGSNLFYPFTKKRIQGLKIAHSNRVIPNMFTNYIAITVILWNLNAYSPVKAFNMPWYIYFTEVTVLPLLVLYGIALLLRRGRRKEKEDVEVAQMEEITQNIGDEGGAY